MKARHEFPEYVDYLEYLKIYFAGLAMQAIITNKCNVHRDIQREHIETATSYAEVLLNKLNS